MDQEITSANSARDYRKGLYKVTMVLFGVMYPTPLRQVSLYPTICMRNTLFMDFFFITNFRDLSLRQVEKFS